MVKEFDNPADSTIGASFVNLGTDDGKEFQFGYNGEVRVLVNHAVKEIKSIILPPGRYLSDRCPHLSLIIAKYCQVCFGNRRQHSHHIGRLWGLFSF